MTVTEHTPAVLTGIGLGAFATLGMLTYLPIDIPYTYKILLSSAFGCAGTSSYMLKHARNHQ